MSELIIVIKELFTKNINDYVYIYGSVLGSVVAAFFAFKTYYLTRKINKKRLPIKLFEMIFEKVFTDHFFKMNEILMQVNNFDFQEFSLALEGFKTSIFEFKFYDEAFYRELLKLTSKLEDAIVLITVTELLSEKTKIKIEIEKTLKDIYDQLLGYYYKLEK